MKTQALTIERKIMLIIGVSIVMVTLIGIGLIYFVGSGLLADTFGKEHAQTAKNLGSYILQAINDEVEDAKSYATRPLWRDASEEKNAAYSRMDKASIVRYLEDMNKKWISAGDDSPIVKEYLENRISLGMKESIRVRGGIAEIFITDKYGGLVSSSDKTSDFYQADEDWWKAAYNEGKGDVYVGPVEFDQSSNFWVVPIAVPLIGASGEVVGICKYSISLVRLFGNLNNFKLGNTGHAILVDEKGIALFHHGISTSLDRLFTEKEIDELFSPGLKTYKVVTKVSLRNKKMFISFARISPPHMNMRGIDWIVMVLQEDAEMRGPLNRFIMQLFLVGIFMLLLMMPIGMLLGGFIVKPIQELRVATEHIMMGDWDYPINVKTGDEIEEFAEIFRRMTADIKSKQSELQSFSNGLEAKVEERTKELSVAQEATLNILEDLQASKEALERTNRELMKLDELKSDFISTVSHELRTPLSIIKEGISLVLDKILGDVNEKQAKMLNISKHNIDRLARIIDDLFDISKIEAGKVELRRNLINISEVVRHAASSFELKAKEKGLEMRLDIDNVIGSVWADPDKIMQVLTNLIDNALKFTPFGHIDISCKDKGDGVACSVSDTGVGILKEDMHKVFDKFQQFGRTAGAGDKGTGLGLSIAKNIIDMHNAAIWVESEPGKGARFTFKLHKYTPQSLFREYVSKAVKKSADEGVRMSIIAVSSSLTGKDVSGLADKRFNDIMGGCAGRIKSILRREDDDVVSSGGEMIVILAGCGKESAKRVQYRLEEVVGKYLADQNADGAIKVNYGYATYPDDAKGDLELIEKAKAALAVSAKA